MWLTVLAALALVLPQPNVDLDYQLGGASEPPAYVGIVVRDRTEKPASGRYNVCYVNGFQTQPDQRRYWRRHWDLVLKRHGEPVTDAAWGEWLLDIRTPGRQRRLATILGRWTRGCADDGFDAVEFDNLDSWSRSHGLITRRDARRYAERLVRRAHAAGLPAAQKNWAELDGSTLGYDFAIAEECARWHECGRYQDHYADLVYEVEYRRRDFRRACRRHGDRLSVVLRDRQLTPEGVHDWC